MLTSEVLLPTKLLHSFHEMLLFNMSECYLTVTVTLLPNFRIGTGDQIIIIIKIVIVKHNTNTSTLNVVFPKLGKTVLYRNEKCVSKYSNQRKFRDDFILLCVAE